MPRMHSCLRKKAWFEWAYLSYGKSKKRSEIFVANGRPSILSEKSGRHTKGMPSPPIFPAASNCSPRPAIAVVLSRKPLCLVNELLMTASKCVRYSRRQEPICFYSKNNALMVGTSNGVTIIKPHQSVISEILVRDLTRGSQVARRSFPIHLLQYYTAKLLDI